MLGADRREAHPDIGTMQVSFHALRFFQIFSNNLRLASCI